MEHMTLGYKVRTKRLKQRLSLRALANIINVPSATLSRIENNTGKPDKLTLTNVKAWLENKGDYPGKTNSPSVRNWFDVVNTRLARLEKTLKTAGIKLPS